MQAIVKYSIKNPPMRRCFISFLLLGFISIQAQTTYFPPAVGNWDTLAPDSLGWCSDSLAALQSYLDRVNSKAFIVLKDGKLVVEWYFDDFQPENSWYWASAGKTMTATLVGLAQQEGLLSLDSATQTYLGRGWTSCDSVGEAAVTVWHQLTMTAGFNEAGYRWDCTDDTCLQCQVAPGSRWFYHNAPYTLLTSVVEAATGQRINAYFRSRIGNPIGMQTGGFVPVGSNRLFFSRARDMARFGLLMLNQGQWDGTAILSDTAYFQAMTTPSQGLNPAYGYLWWLNGQSSFMLPNTRQVFNGPLIPNAPTDLIAGLGANDQKLYVVPSQNLVIIRLGDDPGTGSLSVSSFDNVLWGKIAQLSANCAQTTGLQQPESLSWSVYPQPAKGTLHLQSETPLANAWLYSLQGQLLLEQAQPQTLAVEHLGPGIYLLEVEDEMGRRARRKISLR